jgi:hypothetical protein
VSRFPFVITCRSSSPRKTRQPFTSGGWAKERLTGRTSRHLISRERELDCFALLPSWGLTSMTTIHRPINHLSRSRCFHFVSNLNAWVHWFFWNPGIHQSMQSGSIARAEMMVPQSKGSHPNCSITSDTLVFACALFPQMNMVGTPCLYCGLIIREAPTLLKALTTYAAGTFA